MSTWTEFYQHSLWASIPLFFVSLALLVTLIRYLIRSQRQSQLFRLPLAAKQDVDFVIAESVYLCLHGPLLTSRFSNLTFKLYRLGGVPVEGRRVWFRTRSSGFSNVTLELYRYVIPAAGRYRLQIDGLGPYEESDAEHAISFTRANKSAILLNVVGIVLTSVLTIASFVFSILRLTI